MYRANTHICHSSQWREVQNQSTLLNSMGTQECTVHATAHGPWICFSASNLVKVNHSFLLCPMQQIGLINWHKARVSYFRQAISDEIGTASLNQHRSTEAASWTMVYIQPAPNINWGKYIHSGLQIPLFPVCVEHVQGGKHYHNPLPCFYLSSTGRT